MADISVDPDEFFCKSLFEQVFATDPRERRGCRWVMSSKTFNRIRRMTTPTGTYLWDPAMTPSGPDMVLGFPVEFDEDAPGATFERPQVRNA